jgi:hypothetical protein
MSDQTPNTPPDPWANVDYERTLMGDTPSVQYDRRDQVDAARAADAAQHAAEIANYRWQIDYIGVEIKKNKAKCQEEWDVMVSRIDAQAEELARMTTSYNARLCYIQQLETERAGRDAQRYVVTCGATGGEVRQIPRYEAS